MSKPEKSFEETINELEEIINQLENGNLPLEKMIDQISHGSMLIKLCQQKLNTMNSKVEVLFKDNSSSGEFLPFDSSSMRSQAAQTVSDQVDCISESTKSKPQTELPF